ncbi:jg27683 [Pararge aegeria aegeria]|uniref:Jg27683 protein n=1 Tax=Pararge aegeria aegeria TaxID=348720 RepID=A0A8S4QP55_9NEOP|nr:jg27683 [Pararge aegeria aegeria]
MSKRLRRRKLFVTPAARTVASACSPIPRTLSAINAVLEAELDHDFLADEWMKIIRERVLCEVCVNVDQ